MLYMFVKAGKGNNRKKEKEKEDKTDMTEAVTQAAHAISSAFSPPPLSTTMQLPKSCKSD